MASEPTVTVTRSERPPERQTPATPSPRPSTKKPTHLGLLTILAVGLFAVSAALGWLASRALWAGLEKPSLTADR